MQRLFLSIMLALSLVTAGFTYQNSHIKIYPNENGGAHVIEEISILITDENSAKIYDSNIAITNDIASWQTRTKIDEIRYHINQNIAPIHNLRIIPLPKKRLSIINPSYEGVLRIEYDTENLFNKTMIKPRTYNYMLKNNGLLFKTNDDGDIILEENDYLYIILSNNLNIKTVDPLSQNTEMFDPKQKEFMWHGKTILEDFKFVYEYEISLREEVENYFTSMRENIDRFINSRESIYLYGIFFIIIVSYIILQEKVKNHEQNR